uniref:THD domain-containing protein n=2 Tax=Myripristis murdjan TaxID=586833 RepID=A0A667X1U1_9TELE
MVHLSHTVQRWSRSYGNDDNKKEYQTILHSVRTACQKMASSNPEEEGNWFTTIYMGAVFNLNRGDHLKTVMDERLLPHLDEDEGKTFFGVFAL